MNWWPQVRSSARGAKSKTLIAPSLLAADFSRLEEEVRSVEEAGADVLHLDVMDGHFVPNITFGPFIVEAIRKLTDLKLDTHLMIEDPDKYITQFIDAGSDNVTIHVETSSDVARDLSDIRKRGACCGITLNPDTPFEHVEPYLDQVDLFLVMSVFPGFGGQPFIKDVLEHVRAAAKIRERKKLDFLIEIDGGVNTETAGWCREAGVDVLVAGTSIFKSADYTVATRDIRG